LLSESSEAFLGVTHERRALSFACTFNGFLEKVACLMAVGKIFVGHGEEQQPPHSGGIYQQRSWTVSVCDGIMRRLQAPEPGVMKTAY